MAAPRILTFNFHEPYLCLMARTGLPFVIGGYDQPPLARKWHERYRPIPPGFTFLDEDTWRRDLAQGRFDVVTPMTSAWDLHRAWPEAKLDVIPDAGHASSEPGIIDSLVRATDWAASL